MPKKRFDMIEYNKQYLKDNYDNFTLKIRKEMKEAVKVRANQLGISSTAYIISLIQKDLDSTNPE